MSKIYRTNYHTHTPRCMHANGPDEEYVIAAIKGGYDELGFSDHTPWNYSSEYVANMRMTVDELEGYVNSINYLKEKYKDKITIRLGLEVEYFPSYMSWLKEIKEKYNIEYFLLGNHFYKSDESGIYFGTECENPEWIKIYVSEAIDAMKTGMYVYLAHPDLFMRGCVEFDDTCVEESYKLCKAAKELNIPLEYNLNGKNIDIRLNDRERYPHHKFWEIAAEVGCTAIIGVDCHDYHELSDNTLFDESLLYLKNLGMKVIDRLHF